MALSITGVKKPLVTVGYAFAHKNKNGWKQAARRITRSHTMACSRGIPTTTLTGQ